MATVTMKGRQFYVDGKAVAKIRERRQHKWAAGEPLEPWEVVRGGKVVAGDFRSFGDAVTWVRDVIGRELSS
jgi:hypothetical protein